MHEKGSTGRKEGRKEVFFNWRRDCIKGVITLQGACWGGRLLADLGSRLPTTWSRNPVSASCWVESRDEAWRRPADLQERCGLKCCYTTGSFIWLDDTAQRRGRRGLNFTLGDDSCCREAHRWGGASSLGRSGLKYLDGILATSATNGQLFEMVLSVLLAAKPSGRFAEQRQSLTGWVD